jgi:predicted transposase YbfD/YdcC
MNQLAAAPAQGWVDIGQDLCRRLVRSSPSHAGPGVVRIPPPWAAGSPCCSEWNKSSEADRADCVRIVHFMQRFAENLQDIVAVDGKTLRRSFDRATGKSPLHMVHAWCREQRLLLGQVAVDGKSNEITAVPKLLELLSLKGRIVTADALNCQRVIAAQVVAQGGDYVLALKGNQGSLHDDVRCFFDDPIHTAELAHVTVDGEHGRIETRASLVSTDIAWLQERHAWPGLAAIGRVLRTREVGAKISTETAYYLLSIPLSAEHFGGVARAHWGVENGLHWVLDVTMNEDQARTRKDHAPQNIALLRRLALNLAKLEGSKESMKGKRMRAAWDDTFLLIRPALS